jgi:hypothetical protein
LYEDDLRGQRGTASEAATAAISANKTNCK